MSHGLVEPVEAEVHHAAEEEDLDPAGQRHLETSGSVLSSWETAVRERNLGKKKHSKYPASPWNHETPMVFAAMSHYDHYVTMSVSCTKGI